MVDLIIHHFIGHKWGATCHKTNNGSSDGRAGGNAQDLA